MTERASQVLLSTHWSPATAAQLCYDLAAAAYPNGAPWRLATFTADMAMPQATYHILTVADRPIGFVSLTVVLDEVEITNVAIHPDFQRQGWAYYLLQQVLAPLPGADQVFLEVRASNVAAQKLYQRCGFQELSTRSAYYQNPREDALIMRKIIK